MPGAGDEEALAGLPIAERGGAKVFAGGGAAASAGAAARGGPRDGRGGAAQEQEAGRTREQAERRLQEAWAALPAAEREAIRRGVRERLGGTTAPEAFVQRLCLEELARRPAEERGRIGSVAFSPPNGGISSC